MAQIRAGNFAEPGRKPVERRADAKTILRMSLRAGPVRDVFAAATLARANCDWGVARSWPIRAAPGAFNGIRYRTPQFPR